MQDTCLFEQGDAMPVLRRPKPATGRGVRGPRMPAHRDAPLRVNARLDLVPKVLELPMDLADASLVILAQPPGHGRIVSTDPREFGAYRFKSRPPCENLSAAA